MNLLIVGNADEKSDKISAAQLAPFFRNRGRLRREAGTTFPHEQTTTLKDIDRACHGAEADALFIRPSWREDADEVVRLVKAIRLANHRRPIFFIDPWDQVTSRFFGVLPYVTKLLKYQRLKNLQDYKKDLNGGTIITDYLQREQGIDLRGWNVSSEIPDGFENRIATGWNVTVSRQFEDLLFKPLMWRIRNRHFRSKPKDIDLFCHMSYSSIHDQGSWYTRSRKSAVEAAKILGSGYNLAVTGEFPEKRTVSTNRYRDELERSRIVFSPFGWGETTWRDYESVCADCLLLKPDISHVDSAPNIYRAGETYVPLKWDHSDLKEKVDYYLAHPEEAARIVGNAREALESYFTHGEFVKTIAGLVSGLEAAKPAQDGVFADDEAEALIA